MRQLVVRLRRLKDHSGLSMRQLAAKTGYSPKSWERYLGGRSLPPEDAVESLARISGDDPSRLLALHEVAAEAWGNGQGSAPAAVEVAAAEPEFLSAAAAAENARSPRRPVRIALVAGAVTLVLAVVSAVLLVVRLGNGDGDGDGDATAAPVSASPVSASASAVSSSRFAPTYTCRLERIDGHWYAGNSRTQDLVLADGQAGPEVAEVQCLLRRAGFSPGDLDGIYGPMTERAVKRVQKRAGLVVDGIIGPHTWKALRG